MNNIEAKPFTWRRLPVNGNPGSGQWLIEGEFPINRGRAKPEAFAKVVRSERDAKKLVECYTANAERDVREYLIDRETRVEIAKAYLAKRAEAPKQLKLEF